MHALLVFLEEIVSVLLCIMLTLHCSSLHTLPISPTDGTFLSLGGQHNSHVLKDRYAKMVRPQQRMVTATQRRPF